MSSVSQSSPRDPSSRAGSVQVLEKKDPSELDAVSQDILRIIPSNREAKNAFDELIQMEKEGKLHEIHSQYLYATGTRLVDKSEVKTSRESDETTDESLSDNQYRQNKQQVHEGYFRLHFGLPMVSKGLKWVLGRGSGKKFGPSRNVDILLAAPGSKFASGLSAAHAFLRLHRDSGVWLLQAGSEMHFNHRVIPQGISLCLFQPSTNIGIAEMQYLIEFTINNTHSEHIYLQRRKRALEESNSALLKTNMSGIPFSGDIILPSVVFRHGLGSGTFASVFEGFDPENGELRAVKRLPIKNKRDISAVQSEISVLRRFAGCHGIIQLLDWQNQLGNQSLHASQLPFDIYLVHKKGVSFSQHNWDTLTPPDWALRRSLCHQLLRGLKAVHEQGWMHRDITPMNLIYFEDAKPEQAVLCDFGKACERKVDTDTRLAAWNFLPPELIPGESQPYNQKLDVWLLGLALILCWYPFTKGVSFRNPIVHRTVCQKILQDQQSGGLAQLLVQIVSWKATDRPSAAAAYDHACFQVTTGGGSREQSDSESVHKG